MTPLEFVKLGTPVTKNVNLEILNQAIHILHNINVKLKTSVCLF